MTMANVDSAEIQRFSALSSTWWDERGSFAPLHRINPVRLEFIRSVVTARFGRDAASLNAFAGLSVLDVGCGGGLVAEPLARQGLTVTGVDAATAAIAAANAHAAGQGLQIEYVAGTVEQLAAEGRRFDVVTALEVIEHMPDPAIFVADLDAVLKPGGVVVLSTLNRTMTSFALGIVAAEYLLGWVPRGTHRWDRFVAPSEMAAAARAVGWRLDRLSGMTLDVLRNRWELSRDLSVNYLVAFTKPGT